MYNIILYIYIISQHCPYINIPVYSKRIGRVSRQGIYLVFNLFFFSLMHTVVGVPVSINGYYYFTSKTDPMDML